MCIATDPNRGRDLLDGHGGPRDADGCLHNPGEEEEHYSNTYDNAPMPHMHRLTWDGIALHAGRLPGYPASHGCVRLPKAFAEKLYGITQIGTPVIIADRETHPASIYDPGLLLGTEAKNELGKVSKEKKPTFAKSNGVTSILVSSADKSIYVIQNGDIVVEGEAEIADPEEAARREMSSRSPRATRRVYLGSHRVQRKTGEKAQGKSAPPLINSQAGQRRPANVQAAIDERMKAGWCLRYGSAGAAGYPLRQGLRGDGRRRKLRRSHS